MSPPAETKPSRSISSAAASTASDFTTPLRSSASTGRTCEDASREPDLAPPPAERRIDEAIRLRCCIERDLERAREERRDGDDRRAGAVDARELRLGTEEAERVLPLLEDGGDRGRLGAGDDDLAAHRLEAADVHDVEVATGGG